MTLTVQITLSDELQEKIIRGIMDNFPEASNGCALRCISWKYDALKFTFVDEEDGKKYKIGKEELLKALPLIFTDKWPKGCTKPPCSEKWEDWDEWLCQADATDDDAFAQLACLGEVIYG